MKFPNAHDRGLPRPDAARSAARSCRRSSPSSRTRRSSSCAAPPAPTRPRRAPSINREVDAAPLLGPFFTGFVEGKVARSLLVDGGTDYGLRTSRAVHRRRRLAQDRPGLGGHRQRLHRRFAARPPGRRAVNVVVRRARARRRARQPAAERADAVRQHAGAVAARRRHLRLGVVRPHRPDQGGGDRAVRRRGGAGPGGGGDADRHRSPRRRPAAAPACSPSTSR